MNRKFVLGYSAKHRATQLYDLPADTQFLEPGTEPTKLLFDADLYQYREALDLLISLAYPATYEHPITIVAGGPIPLRASFGLVIIPETEETRSLVDDLMEVG